MQKKQNKLILIIDDSSDNQALLKLLFEEKGFQVYTASNGKEALCLLNDLSYLPQIILLDAQMPIMDGFQFRLEQSKNDRIKNIPVIVMTGDDDILIDEKMNYPREILVKPLQMQTLIESVLNFT